MYVERTSILEQMIGKLKEMVRSALLVRKCLLFKAIKELMGRLVIQAHNLLNNIGQFILMSVHKYPVCAFIMQEKYFCYYKTSCLS